MIRRVDIFDTERRGLWPALERGQSCPLFLWQKELHVYMTVLPRTIRNAWTPAPWTTVHGPRPSCLRLKGCSGESSVKLYGQTAGWTGERLGAEVGATATAILRFGGTSENLFACSSRPLNTTDRHRITEAMWTYFRKKTCKWHLHYDTRGCCPNENLCPLGAVCLFGDPGKPGRFVHSQGHIPGLLVSMWDSHIAEQDCAGQKTWRCENNLLFL